MTDTTKTRSHNPSRVQRLVLLRYYLLCVQSRVVSCGMRCDECVASGIHVGTQRFTRRAECPVQCLSRGGHVCTCLWHLCTSLCDGVPLGLCCFRLLVIGGSPRVCVDMPAPPRSLWCHHSVMSCWFVCGTTHEPCQVTFHITLSMYLSRSRAVVRCAIGCAFLSPTPSEFAHWLCVPVPNAIGFCPLVLCVCCLRCCITIHVAQTLLSVRAHAVFARASRARGVSACMCCAVATLFGVLTRHVPPHSRPPLHTRATPTSQHARAWVCFAHMLASQMWGRG